MSNSSTRNTEPVRFVYKGGRLPRFHLSRTVWNATAITAIALTASAVLVYAIYSQMQPAGLAPAMLVTLAVTTLVAFPLSFYFSVHQFKLYRALTLLDRLARYDGLSGLFNRSTFVDIASHTLRLDNGNDAISILYVDADHFKQLNDNHGHGVGDRAIELIGATVVDHIREGDLAGRLGGEEFCVLLRRHNELSAEIIATRMARAIELESLELGLDEPITVSVGVATSRPGESFESVCQRADAALYMAKEKGRNRVERHLGDLRTRTGEKPAAA